VIAAGWLIVIGTLPFGGGAFILAWLALAIGVGARNNT
jgi:hypothetical protein